MANRSTRFILKNNKQAGSIFSGATLYAGEPIVNTADGIMMFSGVTTLGGAQWTSAGDGAANSGGNNNFFEVGSNLYNLKIRNKITSYGGGSLVGQFLSGTTDGFVLAPITSIVGVDTYVTGFTYTSSTNTIYLRQNVGQAEKPIYIDSFSGLTINGTLSGVTSNFTNSNIGTLNATGATITTLGSSTINVNTLNATGATITTANITTENVNTLNATGATITTANITTENVNTLNATGATITTLNSTTINVNTLGITAGTISTNATNPTDIVNYQTLTGYSVTTDTFVTGGTDNKATTSSPNATISLRYSTNEVTSYSLPYSNVFTTGLTYNASNNTFTISDNSGNTYDRTFTTVSGLTVNSLAAGQVVYAGANKELKSEASFEYNDSLNKLYVDNLAVNNTTSAATFGVGGVVIGTGGSFDVPGNGNLTVHGSLTVFGPTISAFTSELYIEDSNIILNYNPTGSSQSASVGAGITIQDGAGTSNDDVHFQIAALNTLTGNTGNPSPAVPYSQDYPSGDGVSNRGWITELNDIVIRSSNITTPKGVRVLAEFDVLDGGQY